MTQCFKQQNRCEERPTHRRQRSALVRLDLVLYTSVDGSDSLILATKNLFVLNWSAVDLRKARMFVLRNNSSTVDEPLLMLL